MVSEGRHQWVHSDEIVSGEHETTGVGVFEVMSQGGNCGIAVGDDVTGDDRGPEGGRAADPDTVVAISRHR